MTKSKIEALQKSRETLTADIGLALGLCSSNYDELLRFTAPNIAEVLTEGILDGTAEVLKKSGIPEENISDKNGGYTDFTVMQAAAVYKIFITRLLEEM